MAKRKIGIVLYKYPLGISTAIVNTIKELNRRGNCVHLFIDEFTYLNAPLKYTHDLFCLNLFYSERSLAQKAIHKIIRESGKVLYERILKRVPSNIYEYAFIYDLHTLNYLRFLKLSVDESFTHLITFEFIGLAMADLIAMEQKLIYYNMELIRYELCPNNRMRSMKILEKKSISRLEHIIMPNIERAKVFSDEYGYDLDKIKILPICSVGDSLVKRTDYFRKKFKISKEKTIVLYSTNILPWAMCHEIVKSVHSWSKEFVLVLHGWDNIDTKYYKDMKKFSQDLPVYFSTTYFDYDEFPSVLASADIALLFYSPFYRPGDENFSEIAGSSNKLAEYLKVSLPIIAHAGHSLKTFVESSNIGLFVDSIEDMPLALLKIKQDYDLYRTSCISFYNNHFRFDYLFDTIYEDIF